MKEGKTVKGSPSRVPWERVSDVPSIELLFHAPMWVIPFFDPKLVGKGGLELLADAHPCRQIIRSSGIGACCDALDVCRREALCTAYI